MWNVFQRSKVTFEKKHPKKTQSAHINCKRLRQKHVVHFLQMLSHPSINIKYSKFLPGQSRLNYKRKEKKNTVAITQQNDAYVRMVFPILSSRFPKPKRKIRRLKKS